MRHRLACVFAAAFLFWVGILQSTHGADYSTPNFKVTAPTPEIAKKVGDAAEFFRREIAKDWLGYELRRWARPCPVRVKVGQLGAGGQTTFNFHPSAKGPDEVCDWNMEVQGTLERILDSVIPHEVSHTIFACHFRRPLPRWADEGAATLVECDSEKRIQFMMVEETINTKRRIPLGQLLGMKEYPKDNGALRVLYAEGYSLANLLVQEGGKKRYLDFLDDAHKRGWDEAIKKHYQYKGVDGLEKRWRQWVLAGSPEIESDPKTLVADLNTPRPAIRKPDADEIEALRGQSPTGQPRTSKPVAGNPTGKRSSNGQLAGKQGGTTSSGLNKSGDARTNRSRSSKENDIAFADIRESASDVPSRTGGAKAPASNSMDPKSLSAPAPTRRSRGAKLNDEEDESLGLPAADDESIAGRQLPTRKSSANPAVGGHVRPDFTSTDLADEDDELDFAMDDAEFKDNGPLSKGRRDRGRYRLTSSSIERNAKATRSREDIANNETSQFENSPPRTRTQYSEFPDDARPIIVSKSFGKRVQ